MKKAVVFVIVVAIILIASSIVFSQEFLGGYSQVVRRFYDPFNRQVFFGQNYTKPYISFGLKSASSGKGGQATTYGAKGIGDPDNPIAYASFQKRGRTPGAVSRVMAGMRGYKAVDKVVKLEPVGFDYTLRNKLPAVPKGTARILSGYSSRISTPKGTIILQVANLPPLDAEEVYEAWLVDDDSGYTMSIGLFNPDIAQLSRLTFTIDYDLAIFDSIIVTKEFYPDLDPRPGETILAGDII